MAVVALPAPAKLNLCLKIVGQRPDGYHLLQTAFQILDFCDELTFEPADHWRFESDFELPEDDNLVVKAARLLAEAAGVPMRGKVRLSKRIPSGAGLGGGSSDAATTLVALNQLWQAGLSESRLLDLGATLGADVPVFIRGQSAWAEGVGELLTPIELPAKTFLVVQPGCQISTAEIFAHSDLTRDSSPITIARFLSLGAGNDCESVACRLYPEVGEALKWLKQWGPAKMTGTGSCVFTSFESRSAAEAALAQVPAGWHAFVANGVNTSPLHVVLQPSLSFGVSPSW